MKASSFIRIAILALLTGFGIATPSRADIFDIVYGTGYVSSPDKLYSINQTTGAGTVVYTNYPNNTSAAMAERASDGMIFYIAGASGNDSVYRWNPATPATAPVLLGTTGTSTAGNFDIPRLAFAQNDVLYGMNRGGDKLYTINQTTGAATAVATITNPVNGGGDLTITPDGLCYFSSGTTLYRVNAYTGTTTVTTLGTMTGVANSVSGMAFDSQGRLTVVDYPSSNYYAIDLTTYAATLVGATGTSLGDLASAPGQYIKGRVFEDVNYGGGAGRSYAASSGVGRPNARVELYDQSGNFIIATTTDANGNYQLSGAAGHNYIVRVVNSSVTSSRGGTGLLPVQTFRTNASSGTAVAVTDRVGGENPAVSDATSGTTGATLNTTTGVFTGGISGQAQAFTPVTTSTTIGGTITNVDFGFNFDSVVNVNDAGQGSLRQFIINANALPNAGLAQVGLVAGKDNAVFMISNGTAAAGLRAANNYFSGGVATIATASTLPTVSDPVVLDATKQPGFVSAPILQLNGSGAGVGVNGFTISAGSSTVKGFVINRFAGSGISLLTVGSNTIVGNYIGTDTSGAAASANGTGITITSGTNNVIGGSAAGAPNVIAYNTTRGVNVVTGTGNSISRNSIFGNTNLGIDLGNNGVTANNGTLNGALANNDMDYPIFTTTSLSGTTLTVAGYVGSAASQAAFANATVEIFKADNSPADQNGEAVLGDLQSVAHGEGRTYLGTITADANGNFNTSISVSGLTTGDTITATATSPSNNTSEFSANRQVTAPGSIAGTVFEDKNYGGGAGRDLTTSSGVGQQNARVELYDNAGAFVAATTTSSSGTYAFTSLGSGNYTVRVVNSTVASSRTGYVASLLPVQTFRTNGLTGTVGTADPNRVGGETPNFVDAASNLTSATLGSLTAGSVTPQSVTTVTVGTSGITGIDFGFNFDTIVNTNDTGQGSLRQFITNANALGNGTLSQVGQTAGKEVSIFMISDGIAHAGLRAGLTNQLNGSGVAVITLATLLPTISDPDTTLDGTTQTAKVGDTNAGQLGIGGTVGVDALALSKVDRPEIQIVDGAANLSTGLTINANNTTVRGLAIYGFGNILFNSGHETIRVDGGTGLLFEKNVIGAPATSFTDPGAARSAGNNLWIFGGTGIIQNNLIGYSGGSGVELGAGVTGWTVQNNELRGNGQGTNFHENFIMAASGNTLAGNLFADSPGSGIELSNSTATNLIQNNTFTNNGIASSSNETAGILISGTGGVIQKNIINANFGAGVLVKSGASAITISQNSIFANGTILNSGGGGPSGQIGIDLTSAADNQSQGTAPYVTINDNGDTLPGGNGLLNFPMITSANIVGSNLVLTGFARPNSAIEFFISDGDPSGFGEGITYLATRTEGSGQDTDNTTGTYSNPVNGLNQGTDTTNRFTFSIPVPGGVSPGTKLTATATLASATSEFSGVATVTLPGSLSGTVFEDANYGGGAGRTLAASSGVGQQNARVELYDNAGAFVTATTTSSSGTYAFTSLGSGNYTVRVVNSTVTSSRTGYMTSLLPVQTFRTNGLTGSVGTADPNRVGGETPNLVDAASNLTSATLGSLTAGGATPQSITAVTVGTSAITGIDFGFNFDAVVNVNDAGQGSLRQFIANANALSNGGLSQSGLVAGKDNAVFMISNGTAAAGLRATNNYFVSGIATIAPVTALPIASDPVVLDATLQPGFVSTSVIELNGAGVPAGPTASGITISAGSSTVRGFVINRFNRSGIVLTTGGSNIVDGNYLGTNAAGTAASANGQQGLYINGSANNSIGGATAAARNVISGNTLRGILIETAGATGNVIKGNYIGTNAAGNAAVPNVIGIYISDIGNDTIGGTVAGEGNVVSGNSQIGIYLVSPGASNNVVQGNKIGVDASGSAILGNGTQGIDIILDASNNTIGGTAAGAGNIIAGNGAKGIRVFAGTGNAIERNSIYGNTNVGIDLGNDAVTPNNGAVGGTANNGMDYPIFTTSVLGGTTLTVQGYVGNAPSQPAFASATIDIYKADNTPADQDGQIIAGDGLSVAHGEGRTYLGTLTADANGNFSGALTVAGLALGDFITATAMDASGNTSEFSANYVAGGAASISGKVFEDVNYGGGAGRSLAASSGVVRQNARVELFDGTGNFVTATTTDAGGIYTFASVTPGNFTVRVVNDTVTSSRTGYVAGLLPVQTFRTDASTGTAVAVTDYVGGENPSLVDAGNGSTTLAALTTAGTTAESISPVAMGGAAVTGVDFGFNFDTVVNVNGTGQGSLRQFITNANALSNTGLSQSGLTAGIENANFMISNGTAAPGLRTANNYFAGGVATISPASPFPTIIEAVVIDGSKQPGFTSAPVIQLNGSGAGGGANGFSISAGGSTLKSLVIDGFNGSGISLSINGNNTIAGNYLGTTADGSGALANGNGVSVLSGNSNTIGGTSAAARNLISGNTGSGISLGSGVTGTTIQGNYIGTNSGGAGAVPNGAGITISGGNNNTIGGTGAGQPNLIYGNSGVGVNVVSGAGNTISGNPIYANGGIGIDLGNDGVTINDNGDVDAGANTLLNFPIINTVSIVGGNLVITGYARPGSIIELYEADPDPTGFGEGKRYLVTLVEGSGQDLDAATGVYSNPVNSLNQGTDNTNRYRFSFPIPPGIGVGSYLTATATDGSGNTSEFSGVAPVPTDTKTVTGTVYKDVNHNSIMDTGETGTGLTLYAKIFPSTSPAGPAFQAVTVDPVTGAYLINGIPAGTYFVVIDDNATLSDVTPTIPPGWIGTEQSDLKRTVVAVSGTTVSNQNFGMYSGATIAGNVFADTGAGGGTANDGIKNGSESGIAGVTVKLTDNTGTVTYDSVVTDGAGNYSLYYADVSATLKIVESNLPDYVSTGATVGTTSGTYALASDTVTFSFTAGTNYSGVNFGDVKGIAFTTDGAQAGLPGATVVYPHTFTAGAAGQVTFTTVSAPNPAATTGWSQVLFRDTNGNGQLDSGEPVINGPVSVNAGELIYILVKEFIPAGAPLNAIDKITVTASFAYNGAPSVPVSTATRTDITTVGNGTSAGLKLVKTVDKTAALPGETITYTITYTNNSTEVLSNVVIYDSTPAFSTYTSMSNSPLPNNLTAVSITHPNVGSAGPLSWTFTGTLAPGGTGTATFQVELTQ